MAAGDAAQQLTLRFEQAQRQLQLLDRHMASLEQSLDDLHAALETLEGLPAAPVETLVPIGGGVRIRALVQADAPALVTLGAGYHVEATPDDARARLRSRIESTQAALRSTSQQADRTAQEVQDLAQQLSPSSDN